MVVASLSFQGAGLILIARFLREHQISWAEGFGFTNRRRRAVLLGLLAALDLSADRLGTAAGLRAGDDPPAALSRCEPEEQLPVHALRVSMSWAGRIALGAAAILLAPVAEEMLFRGILYPAIKQAGYPRLALWGTRRCCSRRYT